MSLLSLVLPVVGQPSSTEDPKTDTAFTTIQTWANGNIDGTNLSAAAAQSAAVNQAAQVVKGSSIISTSESRTNTAYGTLPTPDQVSSVVLATGGLLLIGYQATWQSSGAATAKAAIFIGANQMKVGAGNPTPQVQETSNTGTANNDLLHTAAGSSGPGLYTVGFTAYAGDATTGQSLGGANGGLIAVFANAGTYTVSVQFKASAGSVTVANRKLWVEAFSPA